MPLKLRAYVDFDYVAPGMGGAGMMSLEANNPGVGPGAPGGPGTGGVAQSLRIQQAEQIFTTTLTSAVTLAQVTAAINQLAADLILAVQSTAVSSTGTTPLQQMQNWATGQPY